MIFLKKLLLKFIQLLSSQSLQDAPDSSEKLQLSLLMILKNHIFANCTNSGIKITESFFIFLNFSE